MTQESKISALKWTEPSWTDVEIYESRQANVEPEDLLRLSEGLVLKVQTGHALLLDMTSSITQCLQASLQKKLEGERLLLAKSKRSESVVESLRFQHGQQITSIRRNHAEYVDTLRNAQLQQLDENRLAQQKEHRSTVRLFVSILCFITGEFRASQDDALQFLRSRQAAVITLHRHAQMMDTQLSDSKAATLDARRKAIIARIEKDTYRRYLQRAETVLERVQKHMLEERGL